MKAILFLGTWLVAQCLGPVAYGAGASLTRVEESMENRILPLVQAVDSEALVYVKLTPLATNTPMAMTPFMMKDLSLESQEGEALIKRVDIIIVTHAKELPGDVTRLIREVCGGRTGKAEVNIRLENSIKVHHGFAGTGSHTLSMSDLNMLWMLLVTCLPTGVLIFFLLRISRNLQTALEAGGRSSAPLEMKSSNEGMSATISGTSDGVEHRISEALARFPQEACIALLMDCYWSQYDGYAAFLWKRIPYANRKALVNEEPLLDEYGHFLVGVTEENLGYDQEPYYLAPLPFSKVDNNVLTGLVRQHPPLMNRLSTMRLSGLQLSPRDRIELSKMAHMQSTMPMPKFDNLPQSPKRVLAQKAGKISIKSLDEERDVLQLRDISTDFIASIASLGWILRLSKAEAEKILNLFSAKDLATGWVGPPEVLERLGKCLPEKKFGLLTSYLKTTSPSRKSPTFVRLHQMTVEVLRNGQGNEKREREAPVVLDFAA